MVLKTALPKLLISGLLITSITTIGSICTLPAQARQPEYTNSNKQGKARYNASQIVNNALQLSKSTGLAVEIDLTGLSLPDRAKIDNFIANRRHNEQIFTRNDWQDSSDEVREASLSARGGGSMIVVPVRYLTKSIDIQSRCPFDQELCQELHSFSKLKISDRKIMAITEYAIQVVNRGKKVAIYISGEHTGDTQRFIDIFKALSMSPIVRDQIVLVRDSPYLSSSEQAIIQALKLSEGQDTNIHGNILIDARRTKIGAN